MIKITRFFYIHLLVFPLLFLAWLSGGLYTTIAAYAVVFVHEIFHLFAALLVHERVGSVIIMPFGMTLRLSGRIIRHTGKEIFIALAGPFANILMLLISDIIEPCYPAPSLSLYVFRFLNLSVLALNLLPCLPLDGGRVLKALLVRYMGYISAASVMRRMSRLLTVILLILGVLLLLISRLNVSLLLVAGFLVLHMTEERKQNEYVLMRELLYEKDKLRKRGLMRSRSICAVDSLPAGKVLKMLSYDCYYIIHIVDENQNHLRPVTEAQVVDAITKKGFTISMAEV